MNIRNKGARGEREIAVMINNLLFAVLKKKGFDDEYCKKAWNAVQRNSLQSAVGGADMTECFGLSVEVKRQETLNVNTWWKQTCASAARNNDMPVLIYRQNKQKWSAVVYGSLNLPGGRTLDGVRCTISEEDLQGWIYRWIENWIDQGNMPRL